MNIEDCRNYCLSKTKTTEHFPFDNKTLVFKVANKIFAIVDVDNFEFINLKCDPELAVELREHYLSVQPGYHMNKKHWNSVYINKDASDKKIYNWIDDSYDLVVMSLPKKIQKEL